MKKTIAIAALLLILFWSGVQSAIAETTGPTVPEFKVKYVEAIFDQGQVIQNSSIVITITNRVSTPSLYYDISIGWSHGDTERIEYCDYYPAQTDSNFTTITIPYINNTIQIPPTRLSSAKTVEVFSPLSIQVQAEIGTIEPDAFKSDFKHIVFSFKGQSSGWSPTQTINLNQESPQPSATIPEFSWLTILPLLLIVPIVLVMVRKRLQKKCLTLKKVSQETLTNKSFSLVKNV